MWSLLVAKRSNVHWASEESHERRVRLGERPQSMLVVYERRRS